MESITGTRVLAVGDVVGEEAASWLVDRLGVLRHEHHIDWVIVNAENCAVTGPSPMNGFGMTAAVVDELLDAGVDVITGGNHSWDGPEAEKALSHERVVRPANLDSSLGQGYLTLTGEAGRLTVVNLLSPTAALPDMNAPVPTEMWPSWTGLCDAHAFEGPVIVDLHGESLWEKAAFAAAVDGSVSAVVGTHTHDPSLRGHLLPDGTAFVGELGMTGRLGFTGGGFDPAHFAAALRGEDLSTLPPFELATGDMVIGAVVIDIAQGGTATSVTRIS